MKTLSISFLFLGMILSGCKKDSVIVKGFYDSMHFVTQGGGQIEFNLYPAENMYPADSVNKLRAIVTKYKFRDTTIQIMIDYDDNNASAFSAFQKAMNNQAQLNGDFRQSTLPTGTWSYIYCVAGNKETEVTSAGLRDLLLQFRLIVSNKIQ